MINRIVVPLAFLMILLVSIPSAMSAVREHHLTIAQQKVIIRDKSGEGMTINGNIPGPTLYFQEGDLARIHVKNEMNVATSLHWHGLLVPPTMDGAVVLTVPAGTPRNPAIS